MKKEEKKKSAGAVAVFRIYWSHTRKYKIALFWVLLSTFGIQGAALIGPLYMRQLFNLLAAHTPDAQIASQLIAILVIVTSIWLVEWASRRLQEWAVMRLETNTMQDLLQTAFGYLLGHSYNFFISNFAGSLTHKTSKFARSFERMADSVLLQFLPTFIFVIGAVGVLFVRNHILGLMLGAWVILFLWFQVFVARLRQPIRVELAEADTRMTATMADAIGNQTAIMLFAQTKQEASFFNSVVDAWRKATARLWISDSWIWAGIGLFMIAIEAGLFYGAIIFWKQGLLTIGDFVLIQAYLVSTFDRVVALNRELRGFYSSLADAGEMVAILETPHEITDKPKAKKLAVEGGAITFKNVFFRFNLETEILRDFNLAIVGGQKVALVGPSGAGKSTITKLLLRMYDVTSGVIDIDSQDIAGVTQDSLRRAISFVPQEPVLFHRSLMENIRYGRQNATDAEVVAAATKANCHEFISALPLKYETLVGERGIKLSGGERQRVAIARAILKNAPILVLDEATSSLDSQSELLIQQALDVLMEGKTVVVIAHRLSTIMKMDRIVVLEHGKIVADGAHAQLLKQNGLYAHLWNIQAGGFILEDEDTELVKPIDENDEETPVNDTNLES